MKKVPLTQFLSPKYWPTWLGLGLLRLIVSLPLPVLAALGYSLGWLFYLLGKSRRDISFRNISVCFPEYSERKRRQINRHHFYLVGQSVFTAPMQWWISDTRQQRLVTVKGREYYDAALAEGKNIILLAPHFMSLDVGGMALSSERPLITMYQYSKNQLVDEIMKRGRGRHGGYLIERKEPLRKLIKLIRQGIPFYYLPDQDAGRKGVFVPFFHELASTIPMLSKFANMTDAVVIPCHNRIRSWGRGYDLMLEKPLENFPSDNELHDTTYMNEVIAGLIRKTPEQYFWMHKRFKTRPPGTDTKFYN